MLLGKLCALDATDFRAASELGGLHFAAGRFAEARAAFENVMKLTPPVMRTTYPAERGEGMWGPRNAARIFRSTEKTEGGMDGEAQLRLGALRCLAEIARSTGGGALEKWTADWMPSASGVTTEALWALYFSGSYDAALSLTEKNAADDPADSRHRQAFIRMALESGQFVRLGVWLNAEERTAEDAEFFSAAFAELLRFRPELVSPTMVEGLFREGFRARVWPCAMELARLKHVREAIVLGQRVFGERTPQRAAVGRELARWHLALGDTEKARAVLVASCDGEGESLDSPVYGAMRDLYFLLPQEMRAAFVRERLRAAGDGTVHGLNVRALLFALEGRKDDARAALSRLLERRPLGSGSQEEGGNSALREWNFTSATASQLVEWNLPDLALHVLDVSLGDEALCALQEQQRVRQGAPRIASGGETWDERPLLHEVLQRVRAQRDALAYLAGGEIERRAMLAKLGDSAEQGAWSRFADALETVGGGTHAVGIRRMEWEIDPQNPAALRKLVDASLAAGDVTAAEAVRRRCIEERINPGNDTTPREFALELADLLEARGANGDALAVMEKAVERNPEELRLLMREAQLFEKCGRLEEAAAVWKKTIAIEGGSASARLALASVLEQRGRFAEAIAVRNRTGPSGDTALPELFCKNGQVDDALLALDRLTGSSAVQAAMAVAEVLALNGEGSLARSVLVAAAAKSTEPRALMQVRAKLLTIPGVPPSGKLVARMQERMREAARMHPELSGPYFEFFDHYAVRFGIAESWSRELDVAWAAGSGELAAGVVLLRRSRAGGAAQTDGARRMCAALLARVDISDAMLDTVREITREPGRADLRLLVAEDAARRAWPSADAMLAWVRLLAANGSRDRATEVLARHAWLAGFSGGAEALGRAWLAAGDPEKAREFLSLAMRQGAPSPVPSVLVAMAGVHVTLDNFRAARLLLCRAFAEPVCHEYAALAGYLDASGELARWRDVAVEFRLTARAVHELQLAIFALHERHGRVREALAVAAAEPSLVSGVEESREADGGVARVDCARLRRVAARAGEFEDGAKLLGKLVSLRMPDAPAELEALLADSAERQSDRKGVLEHAQRAAELRPVSWEFSRRAAENCLVRNEAAKARGLIERFLSVSQSVSEREAALDFWERANDAARR